MDEPRYRLSRGGVSELPHQLVFCPKYGRPVPAGEVAEALAALLRERAALGCAVEGLEVLPDHVRLVLEAPPPHAPQHVVHQLKGYTSRVPRGRSPAPKRRLPAPRSRACYVGSAGHASAAAIRRYVAARKGR